MSKMDSAVEILVCDDMVANIRLLSRLLGTEGYKVRAAVGGQAALGAVRHRIPDLIIMDVMMPGMSGYEVCEQIHQIPGAESLPVIFISGLSDSEHRVHAFTSGGVDYITKPFKAEEVQARVANHLLLHDLQQQLQARNRQLEALQQTQAALTNHIVNDMRPPLTGLVTALGRLAENINALTTAHDDVTENLNTARDAARTLMGLLDDTRHIMQQEAPAHRADTTVYSDVQGPESGMARPARQG